MKHQYLLCSSYCLRDRHFHSLARSMAWLLRSCSWSCIYWQVVFYRGTFRKTCRQWVWCWSDKSMGRCPRVSCFPSKLSKFVQDSWHVRASGSVCQSYCFLAHQRVLGFARSLKSWFAGWPLKGLAVVPSFSWFLCAESLRRWCLFSFLSRTQDELALPR